MNLFDFLWTLPLLLVGLWMLVVVRSRSRKTEIVAIEPYKKSPAAPASSDSNQSSSSTTLPMENTPVSQTEANFPDKQSAAEDAQLTQTEPISQSIALEQQENVLPEPELNSAEPDTDELDSAEPDSVKQDNQDNTDQDTAELDTDETFVEPDNTEATAETSVEAGVEVSTEIKDGTQTDSATIDRVEAFKQTFLDNLLQVQGQSLHTATSADCYIVLVKMVCRQLSQLNSVATDSARSRIVAELAIDFTAPSLLTTSLTNLGMVDQARQGLEELGLNLLDLSRLETAESAHSGGSDSLSEVLISNLEALATASIPAIGYGIRREFGMSEPGDGAETESLMPRSTHHFWEVEQTEAIVEVGFGGYTCTYTDGEKQHVGWFPETIIKAIPYDVLIPGYRVNQASVLRLWQVVSGSDLSEPLAQPAIAQNPNQQFELKQYFFLVSCAVQDLIRLHLQSNTSIETLHERVTLHFNDAASALAIIELMRWLVDEYKLAWQQSWEMAQIIFSCTLRDITPEVLNQRWSIQQIKRLLPRHAEIIEELNRQLLAEIRAIAPDYDRLRRMALIDEAGLRSLRAVHLAFVGSHAVNACSTLQNRLLQQKILPDFSEQYAEKFGVAIDGISIRKYLLQGNTRLADLLTRWIGDTWVTDSSELGNLKDLVSHVEFCGEWWQTKRDIKQDFAHVIDQQTGQSLNLNSLFDVQFMPIQQHHRQMLNLLHVITLYARLKINSNTDTIQRFAHRSVPRTCIFAGATNGHSSIAELIAKLIQSVAAVINADPDVQGRLQVLYLAEAHCDTDTGWQIYAAADLSEHLTLVSDRTSSINTSALKFALNGSVILATPSHLSLEIQQTIGTKSVFLFGRTDTEETELIAKGHVPQLYYDADAELRQAIDLIASGYFSYGDSSAFQPLVEWLLTTDPHLVLADYQLYMNCQERLSSLYQDQKNWTRAAILTTAHMNLFCADRAILDRL